MKTIIEMANQCQLLDGLSIVPSQVQRFADLVRADEREACARVVEGLFHDPNDSMLEFIVDAILKENNK